MPTAGTWKVPFRGKFNPYTEGRRVVPPFSIQVSGKKIQGFPMMKIIIKFF